jgi:glycosyltransferase involved in cell wall biosynthesis
MSLRASAIVCTHNRSASVRRTAASLLRCEVADNAYEVIVVDNASTDATAQVIHDLIAERPTRRLRYLREERLGLHHARHLGARAAEASLLLYTDDDVEVEPQWVQAYIDAFAAHPEMVAAGGRVLPRWEVDPPRWLLDCVAESECYGPLALIDRGDAFLLGSDGYFFGVNMAIRYSVLKRFGGFRPELFGRLTLGPGEWGVTLALQAAGEPIGYVPGALVRHHIPAQRMRPEYSEEWVWHGAAGEMFERWHHRPRTPQALGSELWRIVHSYWRPWLRAWTMRAKPDPEAARMRSLANRGWCELAYLWRMMSRKDLKAYLDAEHFGP